MKNQKGQRIADREARRESSSFSGEWEPNLLSWDEALPDRWDTDSNLDSLEPVTFDSSVEEWETDTPKWDELPEWDAVADQWEPLPENWEWADHQQTKRTKAKRTIK